MGRYGWLGLRAGILWGVRQFPSLDRTDLRLRGGARITASARWKYDRVSGRLSVLILASHPFVPADFVQLTVPGYEITRSAISLFNEWVEKHINEGRLVVLDRCGNGASTV